MNQNESVYMHEPLYESEYISLHARLYRPSESLYMLE